MSILKQASELFQGFSKLDRNERWRRLVEMGALSPDDISFLRKGNGLNPELGETFIENVIGSFSLPLGVATNFRIDNKDYVIPMAVEETSIVAACSKTAKWIRESGEITTEQHGEYIIGQIQIAKVKDYDNLHDVISKHKKQLIDDVNCDIAKGIALRGGGVEDIQVRRVERGDGTDMAVIHVHADTCDAMGANLINQICEYLKAPIEALSNEQVTMCILSNLSDTKLTSVKIVIRDIEPELAESIAEASLFARQDPYRAATHNKGILNGIDPVLIATGNDWRAVEAGVHAYAARDGQYRAISDWHYENGELVGTMTAPILLGTVGGVTRLHPTAKLCMRMLGVKDSEELARIVMAVGLVQNLGAIRALATVGIIQGHLKLHISNLTLDAGAKGDEIPILQQRLREILQRTKRVTLRTAKEVLAELRGELGNSKPQVEQVS